MHLTKHHQAIKAKADQLFYYSEGEDLRKRESKKGGWSLLEVIFHVNCVNAYYLNQMTGIGASRKNGVAKPYPYSLVGRLLLRSVRGLDEKARPRKGRVFKSPRKVDPHYLQKKGIAVAEQVVFRDFLRDWEQMGEYLQQLPLSPLEQNQVRTLIPIVSINQAETLELLLKHTYHHLLQAERILKA